MGRSWEHQLLPQTNFLLQKDNRCIRPLPLLPVSEDSCTYTQDGSPLHKTLHVLKHVTDKKKHISRETKCKIGSWKKPGKLAQGQGYPWSPGSSSLSMVFLLPYPAFLLPLRSCSIPDGLGRWPLTEIDEPVAGAGFQTQAALLTNHILSLKNARPSQADGCGQASPALAWS